MQSDPQPANQPASESIHWQGVLFEALLVVLILIGTIYRLGWVNWSQGASLHPDEYGLTNTLTQLALPKSIAQYFNTGISPLSPYPKYAPNGEKLADGPDNRMRWGQWPITIYRAFGQMTGNTGYDEIRLMGRSLSALADILSLLFIFLVGRRLYNHLIGLLAAALSSLAVMQIQQSHFMTSDNLAALFTIMALYCAVRAAQTPGLFRKAIPTEMGEGDRYTRYLANPRAWPWYILFGVTFGMALASRINLAPLAGMILLAAFISIADLGLKRRSDLVHIALVGCAFLAVAGVTAALTFRITQPMSFRAATGETTFFTLHLNPDWMESMQVAQNESNGIGGGPPSEQWANRPAILFPLVNMVMWGMGLPLGLAAWLGFLWAGWRLLRYGQNWRAHLIPLAWAGGYFLFMGTRWVKSVRYFLPIYPTLCLLAAWGLIELWHWRNRPVQNHQRLDADASTLPSPRRTFLPRGGVRSVIAGLVIALVLCGTLSWATAFVNAVYRQDHTRIQASKWILDQIPAPFQLAIETSSGISHAQVGATDGLVITGQTPFVQFFSTSKGGTLKSVTLSHAAGLVAGKGEHLEIMVARDAGGSQPVSRLTLTIPGGSPQQAGQRIQGEFQPAALEQNTDYYLLVSTDPGGAVRIDRTVISNENWDEGLPVPVLGVNPFGDLFRGLTMEVRWGDDLNKRAMFLDNLAQVDYIILPSQRAIWSASRIPLTYPMTLEYYRALFDGRLGFDLAAEFDSPMQIGALFVSDVGGTFAWNSRPRLPLFNTNFLAAEEAFSVYDHPPVWIFKKRADFNLDTATAILSAVDLSKVIVQSPREATPLK